MVSHNILAIKAIEQQALLYHSHLNSFQVCNDYIKELASVSFLMKGQKEELCVRMLVHSSFVQTLNGRLCLGGVTTMQIQ